MQVKFEFLNALQILQELMTFAKIKFSGFFSVVFEDIDLKFVYELVLT